jgi:rhomboid family GlyGly-CTERM serine protease
VLLESLVYSRQAVIDGDFWRLAGASIAHLSAAHLLANLAALALLVTLLRPVLGSVRLVATLAVGALGVPLGIHLLTTLDWYAGLSGALYTLLGGGAIRLLRTDPRTGLALLVATGTLVLLDQGRSVSWLGEPLAPQSHLIGFVIGLLSGPLSTLARAAAPRQRAGATGAAP